MKLGRSEREDVQITLTPLIDVVFLLLIFFMVSTTFEREAEIAIELPEADAEASNSEAEAIEVWIDADGRFFLGGRPLPAAGAGDLSSALEALVPAGPRPALVINADAATPYQAVITAMDAASRAGFVNLSLPVRTPSE